MSIDGSRILLGDVIGRGRSSMPCMEHPRQTTHAVIRDDMKKCLDLVVENLSRLENKKSIFFTAANSGEGTTTAVLSTAKVLSEHLDARILLVDGNVKRPALHRFFNLSLAPGLGDALLDPNFPVKEVISEEAQWAHVITCGEADQNGTKRLTSSRFRELFQHLTSYYDYIFFDMGPVNQFPALYNIISRFDGVVLVVACESTRWEVAQNVKRRLESAGGDILGVVLNKRRYYIPKWLYKYV